MMAREEMQARRFIISITVIDVSPVSILIISHCTGRHFKTKLMSQYIGAGQNDRFDVRMEEVVSKAKNPAGPF